MDIVCHLHAPSTGANRSAPPMVASGPLRHFAATQQFGRFRNEADIAYSTDL